MWKPRKTVDHRAYDPPSPPKPSAEPKQTWQEALAKLNSRHAPSSSSANYQPSTEGRWSGGGGSVAKSGSGRLSGIVKKWENGFGFIEVLGGGQVKSVFVHQTQVQMEGFRSLLVGSEVEFTFETNDETGKTQAVNVTGPGGAPPKPGAAKIRPGGMPPVKKQLYMQPSYATHPYGAYQAPAGQRAAYDSPTAPTPTLGGGSAQIYQQYQAAQAASNYQYQPAAATSSESPAAASAYGAVGSADPAGSPSGSGAAAAAGRKRKSRWTAY